MEELHRELLAIGFSAGDDLGLVLAGGYALTQHGLLGRPSRDIDFATATLMPLAEVTERLACAYERAGYRAEIIEATPRMARIMLSTDEVECEVDLLKEAIGPPARLRIGPVLAFDDAVGLKVRALHERAVHRDYIDVHAASKILPWRQLEALGARHTPGFSLAELADRLGNIGELVGDGFERYGLDAKRSRRSCGGRSTGSRTSGCGWRRARRRRCAARMTIGRLTSIRPNSRPSPSWPNDEATASCPFLAGI